MKVGLVGYQGSGKSTLFEWLTGVAADPAQTHSGQAAMAEIPDPRVERLAQLYGAKKTSHAAMEMIDTPGLSRSHEGNAARLAVIREAGCLVLVVAAFRDSDPAADWTGFDEDLKLADMEVVSGRVGRVQESLKKPHPRAEREHMEAELKVLQNVLAILESGKTVHEANLPDEQLKFTRAFRLLTEKPRMILVNTADDEVDPERFTSQAPPGVPVAAVPAGLELELARMSPEDRAEFEQEMGVGGTDRDALLLKILDAAGYMVFFTASEKEVRSWLFPQGGTAVEAAGQVHTDLARGFIRAEVMTVSDLLRLGSEREVKAQHLLRQEPKDYVVQDDDILFIRSGV